MRIAGHKGILKKRTRRVKVRKKMYGRVILSFPIIPARQ
jgi:hypothetical protein